MKTVIESSFRLGNRTIQRYHSFPVYSDKIEETLSKQLAFLRQYDSFKLTMKVTS